MRVVVLSDTHSPRRWKRCPAEIANYLQRADLILHAGDVCTVDVLEELSRYAPVGAVLGNNDLPEVAEWGAPETLEMVFDGLKVAMIHDSGQATGRLERMRRRFPDADLVIFGHSHIPMDAEQNGLRIFNPGSPTDKRRQPYGSLGVLEISDGRLQDASIIALP
ncbi:MAG TPA: metallophosphoesterase family protein [Propionibacteriaceae bacterium]|nr:metallophosphoesterase family protein [Propionibacteriaceae bacterium]